jgi:hypothetical protein
MYVLNPEVISESKIFYCNGIIANWLMFEKSFPLLCRKGRLFGFMKTDVLNEILNGLPFWLRVSKVF